jgi:uncharacterized phiE125 gp8 family phage protein
VSYVDGDGAVQVMDPTAYQVKTPAGTHAAKGWVEPTPGTSWPATRLEAGAVRIQYVCGYGDTDDSVPELLKASILYLVATYDQFRVPVFDVRGTFEEVPFGVGAMLDPFKSLPSVVLR